MAVEDLPNRVTADQVRALYRVFLKREPESAAAVDSFLGYDLEAAATIISQSPEAKSLVPPAWIYAFNARIPVDGIIRAHENRDRRAVLGRFVNFLGVVVDPAFVPHALQGKAGKIEDLPIPGNWHADMSEWAAALRAVDLARGSFRIIELGCGWGCWLLNTGVAARNKGLKVDLIGAEGDEGHVAFAERACLENGFAEDEFRIRRGIVGPRNGTALFPRQEAAGVSWGLEPVFDASEAQVREAATSGYFDVLPVMTLKDLADDGQPVDLLHIDIQGGEADFIDACAEDMDRLVSYAVIGTHSRSIEGRIFSSMLSRGWELEVERPAVLTWANDMPVVQVDGVQGWRNSRLRRPD